VPPAERPLRTSLTRRERWLLRLLNVWPPYLGAGVRVRPVPGRRAVDVRLVLRFWNRNYFGTQFGGSLYSMCDPFLCLLALGGLGGGYVVWDKAAEVRFLRPGRGPVSARFELTPERLGEIRRDADRLGKVEPSFHVEVRDAAGEVVAEIDKLLYVRRKDRGG
jgi:acyl-coenzyme A thioesterase PaaI-like protein